MGNVLEEVLKHYGVKGMKWGVRKDHYRAYIDKNATKATEGRIKRLGSAVNMARYGVKGAKMKAQAKFDEEWYNRLDTGKQYIEKGHKLSRVARGVDENVLAGRLYVAKRKDDADMYRATIPFYQKKGLLVKNHIILSIRSSLKLRNV